MSEGVPKDNEEINPKLVAYETPKKRKEPPGTETGDSARQKTNKTVPEDTSRDPKGTTYRVTTRNRYEPLTDSSDSDTEPTEPNATTIRQAKPKKVLPPPPLILHDIHDHRQLTKLISEVVKGTYNIKYTREGTNLYVNDPEQRKLTIEKLRNNKINFHTYTDRNDKTTSYVLKGLSRGTLVNDILVELETKYNIVPTRCVPMKVKGPPLFLVAVPSTITRQQIGQVETVDRTIIRWETYKTTKRITQCRRCQSWGHATSNCFAAARCLKCAAAHFTHECIKAPDTPAKCANCGGDHPASAIICPLFTKRKNWLDERAASRRQPGPDSRGARRQAPLNTNSRADFPTLGRTFAPAPTVNPWGRQVSTAAVATTAPSAGTSNQARATTTTATPQAAGPTLPVAAFKELAEEMRKLNQLINVHEVLRQIKELNRLLQGAASQGERMQIAVQFFATLP